MQLDLRHISKEDLVPLAKLIEQRDEMIEAKNHAADLRNKNETLHRMLQNGQKVDPVEIGTAIVAAEDAIRAVRKLSTGLKKAASAMGIDLEDHFWNP